MLLKDKFPLLSYWLGKKLCLLRTFFYRRNPVKWTLRTYKRRFGSNLDLKNPVTFYDKMNYWKHYSYTNKQDELTDKIEVKKILERNGFRDLCAECYFETSSIKDLKKWLYQNKNKYEKFVIKSSHSCGDVFIYDKGEITKKNGRKIKNLNKVLSMLRIGLRYNHYYTCFESNYKNIKPRVYVEEFLDLSDRAIEYEFMCNYGKIVFTNIVRNRQSNHCTKVLVDGHFNYIEQIEGPVVDSKIYKEPNNYNFIKKFITQFVATFPFCRVDFIVSDSKLYFCEFTFVKSGGIDKYKPEYLNKTLGDLFSL